MRIPVFILIAAVLLSAAACDGTSSDPRPKEAISRETFVQAYYQLRSEGLRSPDSEITLVARDRILNDLGVTEEDLLNFVDVWGNDGEVMQGIWQEVDSLGRESRRSRAEDPSIDGYEPTPEGVIGRGRSGG
ncbi:MAG: hypothetical protein MUO50_13070 [Longimicrobiales bacterium]|nr:hypothetical protein [Longimicrobiales bacterium]